MLVEKKYITLPTAFVTEGGDVLPQPVVAYEAYGSPDNPPLLIAHGGLSSCHAAGRYSPEDPRPGWWDALIGPEKPFDTNRYYVLSPNALGSMYGSTGPLQTNPQTGIPYGPDFPALTLRDQVHFLAAFLDAMKISRLATMAGLSMGSLHTLTFAALYPGRVDSAIAVATAGFMPPSGMAMHHFMINCLRHDPDFNGGRYAPGKPLPALRTIWQVIKLYYTSHHLFDQFCAVPHSPDAQKLRAQKALGLILAGMENGISAYDPNAFIAVLSAINTHDLGAGVESYEAGVCRIRCPLLLINIDTDQEFPPACAEEIAALINSRSPGQVSVRILTSHWGHLACSNEPEQLVAAIAPWMQQIHSHT